MDPKSTLKGRVGGKCKESQGHYFIIHIINQPQTARGLEEFIVWLQQSHSTFVCPQEWTDWGKNNLKQHSLSSQWTRMMPNLLANSGAPLGRRKKKMTPDLWFTGYRREISKGEERCSILNKAKSRACSSKRSCTLQRKKQKHLWLWHGDRRNE